MMVGISSPTRDLQLRSPRQLMASRRLQSDKSLIQEVRNSLTMPGSPTLNDAEEIDNRTPTLTTYQPKLAHARSSFHEMDEETVYSSKSTRSTQSTKSTRSVFSSIFRRPKKTKTNDDASVSSTKSWWQKKRRFKMRNPLKRRRKKKTSSEQMIADFFDVQSVASAPDLHRPRTAKANSDFETRSVISQRSSGSIGFRFLFRRKKKVDELESDFLQFGGGIIDASEEMGILDDDEEITLGSGFDDSSYYSADDYTIASRDSLKSIEEERSSGQKKPTTFLDRIVNRREKKKRQTNLRKARPDATAISDTSSVENDLRPPRRSQSPQKIHKNRSIRSLNDLPDQRSLNRWDSGRSLVSEPCAPKKPQRKSEPQESAPKSEETLVVQLSETKGIRSMRNLSSNTRMYGDDDEMEDGDDSDGDDSVLSLLSGLLAAWSEEQQKTANQILGVTGNLTLVQTHTRGILKTSKKIQEQKEIDRQVVFDSIEIREYERIVGDNPSCTRGPPISIGWSYFVHQKCDVEYYETSVKPPRRSKKEFHLAAERRTQLLLEEWQYPEEELQKARREATYVQYCRAKTSFSGSRAAAKEAAFLRKANSRPKAPGGTIPLTRVSHDLSVDSVVSAAMQHHQQQRQNLPDVGIMFTGEASKGTCVKLDLVSSSIESEA